VLYKNVVFDIRILSIFYDYDSAVQREPIDMLKSIRTQKSVAVIATLVVCLFTVSQALWAMGPSRLLPNGKVKVYQGDQLVSVLSEEAPVPEGVLLAPEGQCGLRMDNLFLVADDGSQFSVATGYDGRELLIRQGTIYFAMSGASGPMTFHTPDGTVTTQRMILNASADGGLLKGYVDATLDGTRIGVLEGGSLVILTAEGERTIAAGRQITLAQADLFDEAPDAGAGAEDNGQEGDAQNDSEGTQAGQEEDDDDIPAAYFWGGGAALAAGIGLAAAGGGGGGGGGGGPVSPAAP
jgi:hypothetical protein